ncbi:hypothetical protein [Paenisporosarcina cavernae]|uniref:Uncharacterized protein n=1 Tax=Paenisporosarcina cavernae TaxID=2320858 RepID=A0A385YW13_9BACL|nr:hypothetical protein [Paenisporosarcina cavernae]AYC30480.1 hypothetical protein D3873_11795 [Paenisporosarcina cavernae]
MNNTSQGISFTTLGSSFLLFALLLPVPQVVQILLFIASAVLSIIGVVILKEVATNGAKTEKD